MPTKKQLAEMDAFFTAVLHKDYDYDWLCVHEPKGCDDCWGPSWLEDYDKETYGAERNDVHSEHTPAERTGGEGDDSGAVTVPTDGVGTTERRDPYVLLPMERVHEQVGDCVGACSHGRSRLSKLDSGRFSDVTEHKEKS